MFWNKKRKCQHIWHYAGKGEIIINNYVDVEIIDASAFITEYQEYIQEKIEYANRNDTGYTGHGQWQDG